MIDEHFIYFSFLTAPRRSTTGFSFFLKGPQSGTHTHVLRNRLLTPAAFYFPIIIHIYIYKYIFLLLLCARPSSSWWNGLIALCTYTVRLVARFAFQLSFYIPFSDIYRNGFWLWSPPHHLLFPSRFSYYVQSWEIFFSFLLFTWLTWIHLLFIWSPVIRRFDIGADHIHPCGNQMPSHLLRAPLANRFQSTPHILSSKNRIFRYHKTRRRSFINK